MLGADSELDDLASWLRVLERIVAQSANMVVITDAQQRIRWVNQTYTQVTGWTFEEVRGRKAGELVHGPGTDRQTAHQMGDQLRQGKAVSGIELVNYRKNGQPYIVLLNVEPIRNQYGQTVAYFSIQSDVTEKRALERSNAQLQHHLQVAQQLARLGRVEFDPVTRQMRWSAEVYDILEAEPGQIRQQFRELVARVEAEARAELGHKIALTLTTGTEFDLELPIVTCRGNRRWVRCKGAPERRESGFHPPGTWTIQDVTVYRELIEQKHLTNEKLQAMVLDRTRNLEEANRSLEAFSHALSHDLKKPIRHMVSYSEIVQEALATGDVPAAASYCKRIVAAGGKLQSVIDGILSFSRLGRGGLNLEKVDMSQLLQECLSDTVNSFPGRAVIVTGMEQLPEVWADPVLMREVWCNLLDNALKYSAMQEQTRLDLVCGRDNTAWTISLKDNGCGFDPSHQAQIFEMFGRADPQGAIPGDGIGLALCQRIVQSHGGRIWAESAPGAGSTFHVVLPASPDLSGLTRA